jgi:ABC-type Mn2+/Zn2+ transport system ATPase subunit
MQTYGVKLESIISDNFYCKKAANSVDLNLAEKSKHELTIKADLNASYNLGLILGASGSGKTTLAKSIFGENCFQTILNKESSIIEQFPDHFTYEERVSILSGVGLTQVPCWIRPVKTLSNGQKARAEAALLMCRKDLTVIDEWTSVVDRTVAKVMSHCLQKHTRNFNKKVIVLSCHYDVLEWLNPDWIIDCNQQEYVDRRLLRQTFKRSEQLKFDLREVNKSSWKYFSKYHYLSHVGPPGFSKCYGLFHQENQIGFLAFSNYTPKKKNKKMILHSNRVVIHPDYCGFGLGLKMVDEAAKLLINDFRIMSKFSSIPMYQSRLKNKNWILLKTRRDIKKISSGGNMKRKSGFRQKVKTFCFEFKPRKIL